MILPLSEIQIDALAPDASSVKAGKGLCVPHKWPLLGYNESAVWGHCQGSGSNPYQTIVDLRAMAYKCSCPSRKFPCKHALGLMYLASSYEQSFTTGASPDWVSSWLDKRIESAQRKQEKQERKPTTPVNEVAQAKRKEARHQLVLAGIEYLQGRLKDIIRTGLVQIPQPMSSYFGAIASRMVDAKASGLASRLHSLGEIDTDREGWQNRLLRGMSILYLLTESYKHIEEYDDLWQTEIRTLVGYTQTKEEALTTPAVVDDWYVLGERTSEQDNLIVTQAWLIGTRTSRIAHIVEYTYNRGVSPERYQWVNGSVYRGAMHFYPSVSRLRATPGELSLLQDEEVGDNLSGLPLHEAVARCREQIQNNPFLERVPLLVSNVCLYMDADLWWLTDAQTSLRVLIDDTDRDVILFILAATGGEPCSVFALANADGWSLVGCLISRT